jgi:hypothetical protein
MRQRRGSATHPRKRSIGLPAVGAVAGRRTLSDEVVAAGSEELAYEPPRRASARHGTRVQGAGHDKHRPGPWRFRRRLRLGGCLADPAQGRPHRDRGAPMIVAGHYRDSARREPHCWPRRPGASGMTRVRRHPCSNNRHPNPLAIAPNPEGCHLLVAADSVQGPVDSDTCQVQPEAEVLISAA